MSPTGDLLVTSIFRWGGAHSSLLSGPCVLRWHSTLLVAAHPSGVTNHSRLRATWSALFQAGRWAAVRESSPGFLDVAQPLGQHRPRASCAQWWRCHKRVASENNVVELSFHTHHLPMRNHWAGKLMNRCARFSTGTKCSLDIGVWIRSTEARAPQQRIFGTADLGL